MTDIDSVQAALTRYFAPWVQQLGLRVQAVRAGEVVLLLPANPALVHHAGILCGQASMAAADTAMVLAISSDLGEFRPVTTVQFQSSFLRPLSGPQSQQQDAEGDQRMFYGYSHFGYQTLMRNAPLPGVSNGPGVGFVALRGRPK